MSVRGKRRYDPMRPLNNALREVSKLEISPLLKEGLDVEDLEQRLKEDFSLEDLIIANGVGNKAIPLFEKLFSEYDNQYSPYVDFFRYKMHSAATMLSSRKRKVSNLPYPAHIIGAAVNRVMRGTHDSFTGNVVARLLFTNLSIDVDHDTLEEPVERIEQIRDMSKRKSRKEIGDELYLRDLTFVKSYIESAGNISSSMQKQLYLMADDVMVVVDKLSRNRPRFKEEEFYFEDYMQDLAKTGSHIRGQKYTRRRASMAINSKSGGDQSSNILTMMTTPDTTLSLEKLLQANHDKDLYLFDKAVEAISPSSVIESYNFLDYLHQKKSAGYPAVDYQKQRRENQELEKTYGAVLAKYAGIIPSEKRLKTIMKAFWAANLALRTAKFSRKGVHKYLISDGIDAGIDALQGVAGQSRYELFNHVVYNMLDIEKLQEIEIDAYEYSKSEYALRITSPENRKNLPARWEEFDHISTSAILQSRGNPQEIRRLQTDYESQAKQAAGIEQVSLELIEQNQEVLKNKYVNQKQIVYAVGTFDEATSVDR
jgi:hypothetical protein